MESGSRIRGRTLKRQIREWLRQPDGEKALDSICRYPLKQVVSPLIACLSDLDSDVKWRAVTAMGVVVPMLSETGMERARVIMRRLIWSLNSESGGIGWGAAEAMGEVMACHRQLAEEYAAILLSYIRKGESFIENESLQSGVLWALGRLGQVRPGLVRPEAALFIPFITSSHPEHRGLAAWVAHGLSSSILDPFVEELFGDDTPLQVHAGWHQVCCRINQLVKNGIPGSHFLQKTP